jgi:hypothetical protein
MAVDRKKTVTVVVSLLALTASAIVLFAVFGPEGCSASDEQQRLLATLNKLDAVVEKAGHVERVATLSSDNGGNNVYRYEADIVNNDGVAIGRLRGQRVEGFGTMKPRIKWYKTPGVPEEWDISPRRPGRGGPGVRRPRV